MFRKSNNSFPPKNKMIIFMKYNLLVEMIAPVSDNTCT